MRRIDRRSLLSGVLVATTLSGVRAVAAPATGGKPPPPEVNATEDLMREHGVIRRTLGVYEELARKLRVASESVPLEVLGQAARLMGKFGEGYHEQLEETEVFPRLVKVGQQKPLIDILLAQHQAGREFTRAFVAASADRATVDQLAQRSRVAGQLEQFNRMYRAHAAREDTELFPAFRSLFSEKAFAAIGDRFEDQETKLLGDHGFEKALAEVQHLEHALGIDDLARYTAHP
jgi:hemerythrin-like domain-containing protein